MIFDLEFKVELVFRWISPHPNAKQHVLWLAWQIMVRHTANSSRESVESTWKWPKGWHTPKRVWRCCWESSCCKSRRDAWPSSRLGWFGRTRTANRRMRVSWSPIAGNTAWMRNSTRNSETTVKTAFKSWNLQGGISRHLWWCSWFLRFRLAVVASFFRSAKLPLWTTKPGKSWWHLCNRMTSRNRHKAGAFRHLWNWRKSMPLNNLELPLDNFQFRENSVQTDEQQTASPTKLNQNFKKAA